MRIDIQKIQLINMMRKRNVDHYRHIYHKSREDTTSPLKKEKER
jgi:hypothetical protein